MNASTFSDETIKAIAERLQGTGLFGIDADLNGRLFETFLNSTHVAEPADS